jgi:hypothetical protein
VKTQVADGVWMSAEGTAIELFVPRLFAGAPIVLPPGGVAVCRVEELEQEALREDVEPLAIVLLGKGRSEVNLLIVSAEPRHFPPVRRRARLGAEGFLFHRGRTKPHDGYSFHCLDRERVITELVRGGVEQTNAPYAWVAARRR